MKSIVGPVILDIKIEGLALHESKEAIANEAKDSRGQNFITITV